MRINVETLNELKTTKRGLKKALIFLGILGLSNLSPQRVMAGSGNFLETIGISTAIGSVLGASTLPFYDQPGKHLKNIAYGASFGAVVGLGVWIYGLGQDNDPRSSALGEPNDRKGLMSLDEKRTVSYSRVEPPRESTSERTDLFQPETPEVWMPLVSLNW